MATTSSAAPKPIDDFGLWLTAFTQPTVLTELGALALCIAIALGIAWLLRRALRMQEEKTSVLFGRRLIDGVMFPLLLLTLAYVARALLLARRVVLHQFQFRHLRLQHGQFELGGCRAGCVCHIAASGAFPLPAQCGVGSGPRRHRRLKLGIE